MQFYINKDPMRSLTARIVCAACKLHRRVIWRTTCSLWAHPTSSITWRTQYIAQIRLLAEDHRLVIGNCMSAVKGDRLSGPTVATGREH